MENEKDSEVPKLNMAASENDVMSGFRELRARLAAVMNEVKLLEQDMSTVFRVYAARADSGTSVADVHIAYSLVWKSPSPGVFEVQIDGGKYFPLPPRLAEVFLYLAKAPADTEGLASWRSRKDLTDFLQKEAGRKFCPKYVNNLVHQLRKTLRAFGQDKKLIQTSRQEGIRLAWKRERGNVIGSVQQ